MGGCSWFETSPPFFPPPCPPFFSCALNGWPKEGTWSTFFGGWLLSPLPLFFFFLPCRAREGSRTQETWNLPGRLPFSPFPLPLPFLSKSGVFLRRLAQPARESHCLSTGRILPFPDLSPFLFSPSKHCSWKIVSYAEGFFFIGSPVPPPLPFLENTGEPGKSPPRSLAIFRSPFPPFFSSFFFSFNFKVV